MSKKSKKTTKLDAKGVRESSQVRFPVIEGIRRCAAILGVPSGILSALKTSGADGFIRGDRVDTGKVIPQIYAKLTDTSLLPLGCMSWKDAGDKFRALNEKVKLEESQKLSIPAAEAQRQANEAGGYMFGELERMVRELPPALAGLSTPEVHKRLRLEVERVRTELKLKLNEVGS